MSCKYKYKGVEYSEQEIIQVINKDSVNLSNQLGLQNEMSVYFNSEANSESVEIHEFSHLLLDFFKSSRPEVYNKGMQLIQAELKLGKKSEIQEIASFVEKTQPSLAGTAKTEEILVELLGRKGLELINEVKAKKGGVIEWLQDVWAEIKSMLGISQMTTEEVLNLDLQSYADAMAVDLLSGENLTRNTNAGSFNLPEYKGTDFISEIREEPFNTDTGITLNMDGSTYEGKGLVVPITSFNTNQSDISNEMISSFLEEHKNKISNNQVKVGLYKFENSDTISIDLNIVVPESNKKVALDFAKYAKQESLFNLGTFKGIPTGEDGTNPREFSDQEFRIIADSLIEGVSPIEELDKLRPKFQLQPSPFTDKNGEAKIENVLEFLKKQAKPQEVEPLTPQEKITVTNILRTKQISSQELASELNRIFADGKFNKEVLNNSSIFSRAEALSIQQSEEYTKNLRELSEKEIDVEDTVDYPQEFLVLDGTVNKYGLYSTQNPLTVEEAVKEQVADTENYEEFANKFNQLGYPDLVNKFNEDPEFAFTMYSKYAQLKKMPSLNSELQPNQTPNKVTEVENSLDISKMNISDINYLLDVSPEVWNESETQIVKGLNEISQKAEVAGLDLSDLPDTYYTKTQEEIENFLRSITTLKEDVSEETLDTFLESYRDFFNIEAQDAQAIEEVSVNHRDKALEKIDDRGLSEYTLFEQEGLLKVAEQTYQRVEKVSLDNLYEMVYAEAVTNDNRVMPNTAYFNSPRPNNQKLQDPQSKEEILNNMRIFIENNVSLLNLDTDSYDSSVAQQMLLYKYFFEAPITVETTTQVEDAIQEIENFDGDSFHLSSAFHTEFQANKLREKRRNSADYQNFYRHFTVDQNGLKLIEDNRITIQQLKENIPENIREDFKNYGAVSRNPSIKRIVKDTEKRPYFNSLAAQRNFYQNNVEALTPFRGDYQNIGEGRIATTEYSQPFIRIGNKLYEKANSKSGTSFYGQIATNNSNFNLIQEQGIINKFGEQEIKSYIRSQENVERNSNFYTKEELEEINQKHFNCGL